VHLPPPPSATDPLVQRTPPARIPILAGWGCPDRKVRRLGGGRFAVGSQLFGFAYRPPPNSPRNIFILIFARSDSLLFPPIDDCPRRRVKRRRISRATPRAAKGPRATFVQSGDPSPPPPLSPGRGGVLFGSVAEPRSGGGRRLSAVNPSPFPHPSLPGGGGVVRWLAQGGGGYRP